MTNVVSELGTQLKNRPYTVYSADLRLKVSPTGLYTYPDVVVVCGSGLFDEKDADTLLNPTLIIEVLSDSKKDYDRGGKFEHYRSLQSFTEYVLIAQDRPHVEHYQRQADGRWLLSETDRHDTLGLVSIDCVLPLAEIYDKVDLPSP